MLPPPPSRDEARSAAQEELRKAIYHRSDSPLIVRALRWLGHLLDRVLGHGGGGGAVTGIIAFVVVLVVVVGIVFWRAGPLRRSEQVHGGVIGGGRPRSAAEHRAAALAAAGRGDWVTAVQERMRAVARELEERGVLDPRAGRTAGEIAREAGVALPAVRGELAAASRVFDDVVYGERQADAGLLAVVGAADEAVRNSRRAVRREEVTTR